MQIQDVVKCRVNEIADLNVYAESWNKQVAVNGNPFIRAVLRDKTGSIDCIYFDASTFPQDEVLKVSVKVQDYKGRKSYLLQSFSIVPNAPKEEYAYSCPLDLQYMVSELEAAAALVKDPELRKICMDVIEREDFRTWPAAQKIHSTYKHGLLHHTSRIVSMIISADPAFDLDLDVAIASAILHDIGKVFELKFENTRTDWTDMGTAFGHLFMSAQYFVSVCEDVPTEKATHVLHCILSHHGDYGAIKPATKEAIVLHQMDYLESRIAIFEASPAGEKNSLLNTTPLKSFKDLSMKFFG